MPKRTKSGKLTKIGSFESKVKGTMPDSEMYAIANKEGLMRGNKTTSKGMRAAAKKGMPNDEHPMHKMHKAKGKKKGKGAGDMAMLKRTRMPM